MNNYYEAPKLELSDLELETVVCLCVSGQIGCSITPLDTSVSPFDDWGTGEDDFGPIIIG